MRRISKPLFKDWLEKGDFGTCGVLKFGFYRLNFASSLVIIFGSNRVLNTCHAVSNASGQEAGVKSSAIQYPSEVSESHWSG